jgi:hypothetical protein
MMTVWQAEAMLQEMLERIATLEEALFTTRSAIKASQLRLAA